MFNFTANFFDNKIYINNKFAYYNNQFLTELLQITIQEDIEHYYETISKNIDKLMLYTGFSDYEILNYNNVVQKVQRTMRQLDYIFNELSISKILNENSQDNTDKLFEVLNKEPFIWSFQPKNSAYDEDDYMSEYGFKYVDYDKKGEKIEKLQLHAFYPVELEGKTASGIDEFLSVLNDEILDLCNSYITFSEDILRVKKLYVDFVDNYLNAQNKFLDNDTLANNFLRFMDNNKRLDERKYNHFKSGYSQFFHTVIKIGTKSLLCQSYEFKSIGAFLYFDLFRGIENNHIPRKCDSCGNYFLIKAGKYTSFCDGISPTDKTKTCKEIGSRKRYDDKCKNDPVWQAYNRAYKAHYARYMKKKMTVSEFEQWSTWAIEWRTQAEKEKIKFDEYVEEIKK